ncbi:hypothetical protein [Streptomyces sp. NPDC056821]|uniref:hypothetical protein n=1 Tax=unclassified Streptomyces TaxID=2593676 RepID=UPI0036A8B453
MEHSRSSGGITAIESPGVFGVAITSETFSTAHAALPVLVLTELVAVVGDDGELDRFERA